ncbi:MAG TPA: peptidoglycan editing factor PgeF [Candidatus Eisenbacteria bacterium]|nr:peptidoglycan editing factor PgeF [Candidatus Eisenbacteria bacterium]
MPAWRLDAEPSHARVAFSTRRGGVSDPPYDSLNLGRSTEDRPESVEENRRRLLASLGLGAFALATPSQVHGARALEVVRPGAVAECDGVWTRTPGLVLAVSAADCLPILFTSDRAVAAAHAGWRGLASGIIESTLGSLCGGAELEAEHVRVHLGPCIRECCYVVGPEVARQFPRESLREHDGEIRLSLPRAARKRLLDAGVDDHGIFDTGACTACEPRWYYSHRRDRGRTGRQWGVAALLVSP